MKKDIKQVMEEIEKLLSENGLTLQTTHQIGIYPVQPAQEPKVAVDLAKLDEEIKDENQQEN